MVCDWLIRGSHDFFGEISGDFHYIFTTSKVFSRHLFTTFSLHFTTNFHYMEFSLHLFTTFSLQIFTTKGRTDRDEQTPWGHTDRFSLHFHYKFSLQRDEQTGTNRLHGDTQTDFHYIFTTFSLQSYHRLLIFTTCFHDIFTTFSRQIDGFGGLIKRNICYLHPYIFTTFSRQSYHRLANLQ